MKLVVDTNILISFFRESPVRFILINPFLFDIKFFVPEYGIQELLNIKRLISKYSSLLNSRIDFSFEELKKSLEIIPSEAFKSFKKDALRFVPHEKDAPFFALALKLNCAIWSNELAFKKQSKIKVYNTRELRKELNIG
jgi:predicted nucleic acid-binding protein